LSTRHFIESLGHSIHKRLDLRKDFLSKVQSRTPATGVSIDYKKELDLLMRFLRERQEIGGQAELNFTTVDMPFRHAVFVQGDVVMPSPGTCGPDDKPLLPLYLEASGLLDITHIGLCSLPTEPRNVVVKYAVRMPAQVSVFGASAHGLTPEHRRRLNEIQLSIFSRLHTSLQERYVFFGRPQLEARFAELSAWTLRQVAYCLEEPSFLRQPANEWLERHGHDARILMEDSFFLPFLHQHLHAEYGERITKKPEKYGGKIDLLFDNIPIELKVRRGGTTPLQEIIDDTYRPAGQACAYATQTRLAYVLVLDLPAHTPEITNLDSCFRVIERDIGTDFPTCIVVAIFHCHHPTPSRVR
jgi:hypothetical protein